MPINLFVEVNANVLKYKLLQYIYLQFITVVLRKVNNEVITKMCCYNEYIIPGMGRNKKSICLIKLFYSTKYLFHIRRISFCKLIYSRLFQII